MAAIDEKTTTSTTTKKKTALPVPPLPAIALPPATPIPAYAPTPDMSNLDPNAPENRVMTPAEAFQGLDMRGGRGTAGQGALGFLNFKIAQGNLAANRAQLKQQRDLAALAGQKQARESEDYFKKASLGLSQDEAAKSTAALPYELGLKEAQRQKFLLDSESTLTKAELQKEKEDLRQMEMRKQASEAALKAFPEDEAARLAAYEDILNQMQGRVKRTLRAKQPAVKGSFWKGTKDTPEVPAIYEYVDPNKEAVTMGGFKGTVL